MHIRSVVLLLACMLVPAWGQAAAPFTPAQYQEIQRLIAAEREQVRKEVRAEVLAEVAAKQAQPPAPAIAADATPPAPAEQPVLREPRAAPTGNIGAATADQDLALGVQSPGLRKVEFSASAGDSDATIVFANSHSGLQGERIVEDGWKFSISAPISNKENGSASFGTLRGFAKGLAGEYAWTHSSTTPIDMGGDAPSEAWTALCRMSGQDLDGCSLAKVDAASRVDTASPELLDAYRTFRLEQYGWGRLYRLKVGASRNHYDFLDAALAEQSSTEVGWTVGAAAGLTTPERKALYSVGFDLERTYDEEDEGVFCVALYPTACTSGRLGAPTRAWHRLVWLEARSVAFTVPFSLRVTRDLGDDVTGVDLPLFLLHDADGAFTGGLRLGWTSEKGFDAGVFIGKAFDVFD